MHKILLIICGVLISLYLWIGLLHPLTAMDQDLGRHLLLGKIIVQTHTIPHTNLLSYTYPTYPFINSHWLSEVIFYEISQLAGLPGLLVFSTTIVMASFLLIFFFAVKRSSLLAGVLVASIAAFLLLERGDVRPEIFSFLLMTLFITILYRYQEKPTKLLFLLIPLEMLWVNLHIYFFVGIVLLVLFLLAKPSKSLVIVTCLAVLATLVNPNGLTGALFPITVLDNYGMPVMENQNIFLLQMLYQQARILLFEIAFSLCFMSLLLSRLTTKRIDWFVCIAFTLAAIIHIRNLPLFVFATFLPFTKSLIIPLAKITSLRKKYLTPKIFTILTFYAFGLTLLVLLTAIMRLFTMHPGGIGFRESGKQAADFFRQQHLTGPIYNNFDIGSYLDYRLYPQEKVFVDGRPEAYPKDFFQTVYIPMQENPALFAKGDRQYHFNILFISHWDQTPWRNNFLRSLLDNKDYALIYLDDFVVIFVKRTPTNKAIVERFAVTETTFQIPKTTDKEALIHYLYFFDKVGWKEQGALAKQALVRIDPNACALNQYQTLLHNVHRFSLKPIASGICF